MTGSTKRVLVTGISGFVALQTTIELLNHGYAVRGTVRTEAKADRVRNLLSPLADMSQLEFATTNLLSDDGWDEAVAGCDYVAHIASPFPLSQPKDENDLIKPAVEGTLRVLKSASEGGVKRVVQTSSTMAVAYGHPHSRDTPFTEKDWTNVDDPGVSAYAKSKTLAERAARKFMSEYTGPMTYASVNPSFILGPIIDKDLGSSADLVRNLLNGKYPGTPKLSMFCVDVRDVAKCHLLALESSDSELDRFVASDRSMWFQEFACALKDGLGDKARRVPTRRLPDFAVRLIALFDPDVRTVLPELGRTVLIDNAATKQALNLDFIPTEEAVVATAQSLIDLGLIK